MWHVKEDRRGAFKLLVGRPNGNRAHGRSRRRLDNIKTDKQDVGCGIDWIILVQNRERLRALVNAVNEPSGSIQSGEFLD
jgi:hypothetical protein